MLILTPHFHLRPLAFRGREYLSIAKMAQLLKQIGFEQKYGTKHDRFVRSSKTGNVETYFLPRHKGNPSRGMVGQFYSRFSRRLKKAGLLPS